MPLSDASTTRAPWSAAHAKAAAMSHARPLPDASRARSGTMPAFGAPQVMSPLPWVPSVSARRAAHARSREAKREPGVLRKRRLDFVRSEPPTPRLGDARLRPRKRKRARESETSASVPELHGYQQSARRCCLFHTDAGAAPAPLARRQTLAARHSSRAGVAPAPVQAPGCPVRCGACGTRHCKGPSARSRARGGPRAPPSSAVQLARLPPRATLIQSAISAARSGHRGRAGLTDDLDRRVS
jgi:hypothetical protein